MHPHNLFNPLLNLYLNATNWRASTFSNNNILYSCNSLLREIDSGRVWHLEREVDTEGDGKGMTGVKTVPEVFLTRLSATKIPLQKFVDDLFNVIFTPNEGITSLPPCIKYLMDFLDSEAARLQINDPEVRVDKLSHFTLG